MHVCRSQCSMEEGQHEKIEKSSMASSMSKRVFNLVVCLVVEASEWKAEQVWISGQALFKRHGVRLSDCWSTTHVRLKWKINRKTSHVKKRVRSSGQIMKSKAQQKSSALRSRQHWKGSRRLSHIKK